jgi:hypothetical protein
MPRCLLWKRVPGCTIPMVPMHLPPMAPMNRVEQIRALAGPAPRPETAGKEPRGLLGNLVYCGRVARRSFH